MDYRFHKLYIELVERLSLKKQELAAIQEEIKQLEKEIEKLEEDHIIVTR